MPYTHKTELAHEMYMKGKSVPPLLCLSVCSLFGDVRGLDGSDNLPENLKVCVSECEHARTNKQSKSAHACVCKSISALNMLHCFTGPTN